MFPITLDLTKISIMLVGLGYAAEKRLHLLDKDHASKVQVFSPTPSDALREMAGVRLVERLPEPHDFADVRIAMLSDLEEAEITRLVAIARAYRVLINVEDQPRYCDFHFSSFTRRGDLLLTVSTNGTSPALGKRINQWLETQFGPEWEQVSAEIAEQRNSWRKLGLGPKEIAELTNQLIDECGWLPARKRDESLELEKEAVT